MNPKGSEGDPQIQITFMIYQTSVVDKISVIDLICTPLKYEILVSDEISVPPKPQILVDEISVV